MDNNIRINQYDSMSSTGPETLSPGSPALPSMQFTSPMPRPIPATGLDIANSQIAPSPDALAADVVTQDPIVAAYNHYTADQLAVIESIAMEASSMFCVGATFTSSGELRDSVRKFAHKKGFSVTSSGTRFSCSRCAAAPSYITRRLKKQQLNRSSQSWQLGRESQGFGLQAIPGFLDGSIPSVPGVAAGDDDASMRYCGYGDDDVSVGEEEVSVGERACGVVGEEASHREDAATSQEVTVLSRAGTVSYRGAQSGKYDLRELYHIFQDLANCIHKVRDNTTKDLLVGTALKLKDVAVGNVEQVYSQPILDTLHSYLHLFGRTMAPQDMFAQVSRGISHREEDGENQYEPEATATLKRSKPPGANGGHRIVQCSKISEARATLIGHNHVAEFAAGLGDPMLCLVEEPFGSMRETIKKWMQSGRNIPVEAVHVVVRRCFYSATRQDSSRNVVEVFVWGKGGTPVKEHCPAYYPVNKVVQWILTNCTARRRKKHILSCLQKPDQEISQHLYDYGTSP
ncbi:hypothetical protein IV203_029166 [Nitzschia inconspicua]|uniref:Uncharacterized protein n=1 Tax=Nitzschia inconspicua TaxID=303405 RepID=A0A9K3LTT5_9STRA|nr:hypothetical protein IV203_029166 [Nitzschia inconspicua]